MKKNNNKGFVLAETLVVTVAVAAIFSIVFSHFYPLMGEYEKREKYDDVDSKYGTYWIKKMIQDTEYNLDKTAINNNGYVNFSCNQFANNAKKAMCLQTLTSLEVNCSNTTDKVTNCNSGSAPHVYVTTFNLVAFKNKVKSSNGFSPTFKDYVEYLPKYSEVNSLTGSKYRVVIEYYRHRFDNTLNADGTYQVDDADYLTYSTIEVMK